MGIQHLYLQNQQRSKNIMFDKVLDILSADTDDIRELAKIAGANPKTFFVGADFSSIEIKPNELEGFELRNAVFKDYSDEIDIAVESIPYSRHVIVEKVTEALKAKDRDSIFMDLKYISDSIKGAPDGDTLEDVLGLALEAAAKNGDNKMVRTLIERRAPVSNIFED